MTVYILFHETNTGGSDESDGYIEEVYASEELAEKARERVVAKAIADGESVWSDPNRDEDDTDWDHDWHVEQWLVVDDTVLAERALTGD